MSLHNRALGPEDTDLRPSRTQSTIHPDQVKTEPEQLSLPFATASELTRSDAISLADACSVVHRRSISAAGWQHLVEVLASLGDPDDASVERPFPAVTVPRNSNAKIEKTG
jgi:hypothetical protein